MTMDDCNFGQWDFSQDFIKERHKYEKDLNVPDVLSEEEYLFSEFFKRHDNVDKSILIAQASSDINDEEIISSSQLNYGSQKDSSLSVENIAAQEELMEEVNSPAAVAELLSSLDEQTLSKEQLSGVSDILLMEVLPQVSDAGLCHVCSLLCLMPAHEHNKLGTVVSRYLLLPRLQVRYNESCSRVVSEAVINFIRIFPYVSCSEILLPLMTAPDTACCDLLQQIVRSALTHQQQEHLLRNFLQNGPERLYEWQISLLHELLNSTTSEEIVQLLIQQMSFSSEELCRSTHFAKLLVHVIHLIGTTASEEVYEQLTAIASSNKSVLKKAAEKALRSVDR